MARPQKDGVDYFPLDVDMDQDDKVVLVEAKHKIGGFGILVKLLMKIYKEGYFYRWTEREQLLFFSKINVDIDLIINVVSDCIKWDFFDQNMFNKHQILTSRGIQKRYLEAVKRRKEVTMIEEYLLVELPESTDSFKVYVVNVNNNPVSSPVNVDINSPDEQLTSTLSPIVKESKVKESKEHSVVIVTNPEEAEFLAVLAQVKSYPLDKQKDLEMYHKLQERYPLLDLVEGIKDWANYKLDKPLKPDSSPRSQINTSMKKYVEWGKNLKQLPGQKPTGFKHTPEPDLEDEPRMLTDDDPDIPPMPNESYGRR